MKRNILFGSVLAAALSVGLGAQAPTGAPQHPRLRRRARGRLRPPGSERQGRQQQQERDGDRLSAGRLGGGNRHERHRSSGGWGRSGRRRGIFVEVREASSWRTRSTGSGASGAAGAAGTTGSASSPSASQ